MARNQGATTMMETTTISMETRMEGIKEGGMVGQASVSLDN